MTIQIPKHLKVAPVKDKPGIYTARIGIEEIGSVVRTFASDKTTVFTLEFNHPQLAGIQPQKFSCKTMKEVREQLTRRIPRDLYMKIYEAQPQK